jgi:hypothetical protein
MLKTAAYRASRAGPKQSTGGLFRTACHAGYGRIGQALENKR